MPKLSLLFYVTFVLSLVIASDAKAFDPNHQVSHNRFLKKRVPAPLIGRFTFPQPGPTVIGVGADPLTSTPAAATQSASTATTADSTPISSASPSSSPAATSVGTTQSQVSQVLPTTTTSLTSSSTSSSSSTSPTSTPSTSSTPSAIQSVQSSPLVTPDAPAQAGSPTSQSVILVTNTASSSASASATPSTLSSSSTGITHAALIVLIVIAASVGGSIIIWTIIRKWKFGKSSSFDDRMQPIDWQPSNDIDDNSGIPGLNRRNSTASSFHSGSGHAGIGATTLSPIPDHDFTAGPANLAPVGGYADLARGPSPQPMMQELARGPSVNARQYQSDQYGVPLHHGAYATHGY
ncbi:uncharacterized protein F5891DRAFT_7230 [Suillus fuscotomentosus]|uniref:Mid2 domain-containing protein n=1 Tax=Suillus fuscotomentosus TaxID=1912939 RepID=A0AAD4HTQ9_9AGAM|nr:uncharacterized protein F5891DRAFT_7230 [Suillus fuscotomentosus]KAG1908262.1 hypothetical protein F5891DRAFT_7230 [Suillus fuscotomentosus]